MRRRAFVPDRLDILEGRTLLSAAPVHLSALRFDMAVKEIKGDFEQYALSGNFERLRAQLQQNVTVVPFGKADGLGQTVNGILARMQQDLADDAPKPIAHAYHNVVSAMRADARMRIDDGSVIVVR